MGASESSAIPGAAVRPEVTSKPTRTGYRVLTLLAWLASGGLIWFYVRATAGAEVPAATQWGRYYGLAGTVLFAFLALYGLRRISYRSRSGTLQFWYRAHLILGLIALVLLGCHSGFQFRSPFLTALQIGYWGTVGTGVFGWIYQTLIRWWMVRHEYTPSVLSELNASRDRILTRLHTLAVADGATSARFTKQDVDRAVRAIAARRGANLWRMPDWNFWDSQVDAASAELTPLSLEARQLIRDLNQVEVLRSYHRFMRGWTLYHLLLTAVAVQMVVWHVITVALYPR